MHTNRLMVSRILQVHEPSARRLGLNRLEEDRLILAFGRWAEGQIQKWIDYAKGALLFVTVPGDSESGMFYVYDRARQAFWMVDPVEASNFGGYRLEEFEKIGSNVWAKKGLRRIPHGFLWRTEETFEKRKPFGV